MLPLPHQVFNVQIQEDVCSVMTVVMFSMRGTLSWSQWSPHLIPPPGPGQAGTQVQPGNGIYLHNTPTPWITASTILRWFKHVLWVKIFHFAALRLRVSCSNSKYFYILKLVPGGGVVSGVQFYSATVWEWSGLLKNRRKHFLLCLCRTLKAWGLGATSGS